MMDFEEFTVRIVSEMKKRLKSGEVEIQNVRKNNDTVQTAMVVKDRQADVMPVVWLGKYYEEMQHKPFAQIADEIWGIYDGYRHTESIDVGAFREWEYVRGRIAMKVVNYDKNRSLLQDIPYDRFLDLAVVYYYIVDVGTAGMATIQINNCYMEMWGVRQEDMKEQAYINYRHVYRTKIERLDDWVEGFLGMMADEPDGKRQGYRMPWYVVTNSMRLNGAAAMLYPEEFKMLADTCGLDLYILPSSVHEIIVLPDFGCGAEALKDIVHEVNETCVEQEDWLSDNVYRYSREDGRIHIVQG